MARLLTAEEIRQLPRTSIVWVEMYSAEEGKAIALYPAMKCEEGHLVDEDGSFYNDFEKDMEVQPGGWWRFWNEEPTEPEREKASWRETALWLHERGLLQDM